MNKRLILALVVSVISWVGINFVIANLSVKHFEARNTIHDTVVVKDTIWPAVEKDTALYVTCVGKPTFALFINKSSNYIWWERKYDTGILTVRENYADGSIARTLYSGPGGAADCSLSVTPLGTDK
jgi:hypothetical protein